MKVYCCSFLTSLVYRTVPESLVWLLAKGKIKEAEDIVQKAARFNGKTIPENVFSDHVIRSPTAESKVLEATNLSRLVTGYSSVSLLLYLDLFSAFFKQAKLILTGMILAYTCIHVYKYGTLTHLWHM